MTGDTHNARHSDLIQLDGTTKVSEEFVTCSVSPSGFEEYLSGIDSALIQQAFLGVIHSLKFLDTQRRGFFVDGIHPRGRDWLLAYDLYRVKSHSNQAQRLHSASMV